MDPFANKFTIDREPADPADILLVNKERSPIEEGEIKNEHDKDVKQQENSEALKTFPPKYSIPKKNQSSDGIDKVSPAVPTEACKLFVGGLTINTTEATLRDFYSQFGRVVDCVVMVDSASGRSRCFGFVTFSEPAGADRAIEGRPHFVDGRNIDAKRAIPREFQISNNNPEMKVQTTRLFVPGIREEHTEATLKTYFENYGRVKSVAVKHDKLCAFIDFYDADPVTKCALEGAHFIQGHRCDVKKALSREELTEARQQDRDRSFRSERRSDGAGFIRRGGRSRGSSCGREGRSSGGRPLRGDDWRSGSGGSRLSGSYQQHHTGYDNNNSNGRYGSNPSSGYGYNNAPYTPGRGEQWNETSYLGGGGLMSGPQMERQQQTLIIPPGYNGPVSHIYQASFAAQGGGPQSSPGMSSRSCGVWAPPAPQQRTSPGSYAYASPPAYPPSYRPYPGHSQ